MFLRDSSKMAEFANKLPDSVKTALGNLDEQYTVFAPTDWAFGKIPSSQQRELDREDEEGARILKYVSSCSPMRESALRKF